MPEAGGPGTRKSVRAQEKTLCFTREGPGGRRPWPASRPRTTRRHGRPPRGQRARACVRQSATARGMNGASRRRTPTFPPFPLPLLRTGGGVFLANPNVLPRPVFPTPIATAGQV